MSCINFKSLLRNTCFYHPCIFLLTHLQFSLTMREVPQSFLQGPLGSASQVCLAKSSPFCNVAFVRIEPVQRFDLKRFMWLLHFYFNSLHSLQQLWLSELDCFRVDTFEIVTWNRSANANVQICQHHEFQSWVWHWVLDVGHPVDISPEVWVRAKKYIPFDTIFDYQPREQKWEGPGSWIKIHTFLAFLFVILLNKHRPSFIGTFVIP